MSGLSSSAWFTGDDGPADPPSKHPAAPVAAPEVHEAECHCDSFSDCYKDVTGRRPRDEIARWTCARVTQWFHENYIETSPRHFEPRIPFEGEPAPRTLPVTPAERCLAMLVKTYAAYVKSASDEEQESRAIIATLDAVGDAIEHADLLDDWNADLTPAGAALLARVEEAPSPCCLAERQNAADLLKQQAAKYHQGGLSTPSAEARARCVQGASVLRTMAAYIARGDRAEPRGGATPIDAPPAKEPR